MAATLDPQQIPRPETTQTNPEISKSETGAANELLNLYCSSLYRKCSNCGRTGHNSRTCLEARTECIQTPEPDTKSKMDSEVPTEGMNSVKEEGEVSEDGGSDHKAKPKEGGRKKGVAWTEEEHKQFLNGLQKLGKGNWRGISRHFVQSKSPTQVASHAQKYFIRQTVAGKRKRRSSLFDLIPENDHGKDMDAASQSTTYPVPNPPAKRDPVLQRPSPIEPSMPSMPALQGPEALAWAYWYQSMLMQSNPVGFFPSLMSTGPPQNISAKSPIPPPQVSIRRGPNPSSILPPGPLPSTFASPSDSVPDANTPAFAAFLAQQSQMVAMLAMNYVPQLSPEYMARYAAGLQIHAQAAQVAEAAQSGISSRINDEKAETEASADDNLSALGNTPITSPDDDEPLSKLPRRSENGSRFELSNMSTETEEFGNGALVKPKASKARSWSELPIFLQDKKEGGSLLNGTSKQSQSTQLGAQNAVLWRSQQKREGQPAMSSQGTRPENSYSNALDNSQSEAPSAALDPNLATSHYTAKSERV